MYKLLQLVNHGIFTVKFKIENFGYIFQPRPVHPLWVLSCSLWKPVETKNCKMKLEIKFSICWGRRICNSNFISSILFGIFFAIAGMKIGQKRWTINSFRSTKVGNIFCGLRISRANGYAVEKSALILFEDQRWNWSVQKVGSRGTIREPGERSPGIWTLKSRF